MADSGEGTVEDAVVVVGGATKPLSKNNLTGEIS